ncbi:MAG: sulfite exporter TauE/SafE family protein [Clostridiales bacterium]|nr:sulfite exporter TauE/SafE family protein [Clostridiales bacterium]
MELALALFLLGVTVSFGSCFAHCSAVILPYIAATQRNWQSGLKATLKFLLVRLIFYGFFGLLAGALGHIILEYLAQFESQAMIVGGTVIAMLGICFIFKKKNTNYCKSGFSASGGDKGPLFLGLITGITPCLPLLSVLAVIAMNTQNYWQGLFYGLAFGTGKLASPLIPLGMLVGALPGFLGNYKMHLRILFMISGMILFLKGLSVIISGLAGQ